MIIQDETYWKKLAKSQADTLNSILWFGLVSSITVFFLSFSDKPEASFLDIKFPIVYARIPLFLFTFFHVIFTKRFVYAVRNYWTLTILKEYVELYRDVTTEGGFFMREMKPRIFPLKGGPAIMENDLTTWLTHITAIFFFLALWRTFQFGYLFDRSLQISLYIFEKIIALYLLMINWIVGTRWAVALSELTIPKNQSVVLARVQRGKTTWLGEFIRRWF